jgi:ribosomal protein S25
LDVEKMNKAIDKKMGKEEGDSRMEGHESKIVILDKCVLKVNTNLERLEVIKLSFISKFRVLLKIWHLRLEILRILTLKGVLTQATYRTI